MEKRYAGPDLKVVCWKEGKEIINQIGDVSIGRLQRKSLVRRDALETQSAGGSEKGEGNFRPGLP